MLRCTPLKSGSFDGYGKAYVNATTHPTVRLVLLIDLQAGCETDIRPITTPDDCSGIDKAVHHGTEASDFGVCSAVAKHNRVCCGGTMSL